jgi:ribosomal protein S18 acetylase RimI-like enzyme
MVEWALDRLTEAGLPRCNIVVYADNEAGRSFWRHIGFRERIELVVFSRELGSESGY